MDGTVLYVKDTSHEKQRFCVLFTALDLYLLFEPDLSPDHLSLLLSGITLTYLLDPS